MGIEKTVVLVIFLIAIAVWGCWDSSKERHKINCARRRRRSDFESHLTQ